MKSAKKFWRQSEDWYDAMTEDFMEYTSKDMIKFAKEYASHVLGEASNELRIKPSDDGGIEVDKESILKLKKRL